MASSAWVASFESAGLSAMQVYDDVLVPRLFTPWARVLVDRLTLEPGEAVLDVACGPGSVTRIAATAVGRHGRVAGVDLSPAMLAIARTKPVLRDATSIEYHQASAGRLPFADGEFDVAICQHGLQFFPDRPAALAEMRRSLRAGGRVAIAVWAAIEQTPAFAALDDVVRSVAGEELADHYRAGPWSMPDADELRELLDESGFDDIRITQDALPLSFESASQLGSTLAASAIAADIEALSARRREQLIRALEQRVAVDEALHAEAVAHLAFARR